MVYSLGNQKRSFRNSALLGSFDAPQIVIWGEIVVRKERAIIPMLMPDDRADRFVHKQTMTREIAAVAADVTLSNACYDSHP